MLNNYLIKPKSLKTTNDENDNRPKSPVKKQAAESKYFIKGPIYWNWICTAAKCGGKTLQVALAIHFLSGMKYSDTTKLPNKIMLQLGVDRYSKSRAIKKLEEENLITVIRKQGQAPEITIINHR